MTSKKKSLYRAIFKHIQEEYIQFPRAFISDYEEGMRNAAKKVWAGIEKPGCAFHFNQAIRRNYMQRVMPKPQRGSAASEAHSKVLRMFMNLQYLPYRKIKKGLRAILRYQNHHGIHAHFQAFNEYFETYWIDKIGPQNFSKFKREHRTNNICESFNSQMNQSLPCGPNIYNFLHAMKLHIIDWNTKNPEDYAVQSGIAVNLESAWDDLSHGRISVSDFIKTNFHLTVQVAVPVPVQVPIPVPV